MDGDSHTAHTAILTRFGLGAVGLVIVASLLFAVVGAVAGDDEPSDPAATGAPTTTDAPTTPTPTGTDPDTASPSPTGAPTTTDAPTTPTETATTPTATEEPAVDPASISIQILDGVLDDNGAAASDVASRLEEAGYRIIAQNRAIQRYDATTVFYTGDNEPAARQIADAFGFSAVEQAPSNLNQSVEIHIVVGADA